jgi:uncharacterized protein involved in response to NO
MTTSSERIREYHGPALFSFGFRPFFLFGALWAAIAVALWLPMLSGALTLPTAFAPVAWHVHELLFGFVPAVVAGFLLTAVPNWTGRLPVVGAPLAALFSVWAAGRIAVATSAWIGAPAAAVIDVAFLAALLTVMAREIIAGQNTRNLKVLGGVAALLAANAAFHLALIWDGDTAFAQRLGIAATVVLIMVIGGRIIPSFTRNWLARRGPGRLPAAFDKHDMAAVAISIAALLCWVVVPASALTPILALVAALANVYRLSRWAGERTSAEPLVLILHLAYAFVPIGFLLLALAHWMPGTVAPSGALHGWTAGAIGTMTLAVMTRASLGHTGQALTATGPITLIYVAVLVAALARIAAAFDLQRDAMLTVSAAAWVAAFAGFALYYGALLMRSRG